VPYKLCEGAECALSQVSAVKNPLTFGVLRSLGELSPKNDLAYSPPSKPSANAVAVLTPDIKIQV